MKNDLRCLLSWFGCLTAALLLAGPGQAVALRVVPWPLTVNAHDPIETRDVQAEGSRTFSQWMESVRERNPQTAESLVIEPVAKVMIDLADADDSGEKIKIFVDRARREAAWTGANLICLEEERPGPRGTLAAARFIAYRVQYGEGLVTPSVLASLTVSPLPALALAGNPPLLGEKWTTLPAMDKKEALQQKQALTGFLNYLPEGSRVRLEMKDGTTVQGSYSGIDEEHRIWIHLSGVVGLFVDRAVRPDDVQLISLANSPAILPTVVLGR